MTLSISSTQNPSAPERPNAEACAKKNTTLEDTILLRWSFAMLGLNHGTNVWWKLFEELKEEELVLLAGVG